MAGGNGPGMITHAGREWREICESNRPITAPAAPGQRASQLAQGSRQLIDSPVLASVSLGFVAAHEAIDRRSLIGDRKSVV